MKRDVTLTVTSMLVSLLLSVHLAQDAVRFRDPTDGIGYFVILVILAGLTFGTLALPGRATGTILMLIVSLGGVAMPIIHIRGLGGISGDFFFVWTLNLLGLLGTLGLLLSIQELWRLRRPSDGSIRRAGQ